MEIDTIGIDLWEDSLSPCCTFVVRPKWIGYGDFDQNPPLVEEMRFSGE